jgi:PKD repeat protein
VNTFGTMARIFPLLLSALLASCGNGSPASGIATTVQSLNHAPVANGGADQTLYASTSTVTLDGSHSSDADNDAIAFKWTIVGSTAPGAALTDETTARPSLTVTAPGTYTVRLVVTDGALSSSPDDVTVLFAEGVLLQGDSSALAKDSVIDMAPVGVSPAQVHWFGRDRNPGVNPAAGRARGASYLFGYAVKT